MIALMYNVLHKYNFCQKILNTLLTLIENVSSDWKKKLDFWKQLVQVCTVAGSEVIWPQM